MAHAELIRLVALTDAEMDAIRDAMNIAFSEYEMIRECQDMIAAFPGIRGLLHQQMSSELA